jgi:hypothetical protein
MVKNRLKRKPFPAWPAEIRLDVPCYGMMVVLALLIMKGLGLAGWERLLFII